MIQLTKSLIRRAEITAEDLIRSGEQQTEIEGAAGVFIARDGFNMPSSYTKIAKISIEHEGIDVYFKIYTKN